MQGIILNYTIQSNTGVISGDDQQHYTFSGEEWRGRLPPTRGDRVDFTPDKNGNALQIYTVAQHNSPINQISEQFDKISDPQKSEIQYTPIDWFVKGLRNYANFTGRARRKEYWFYVLVQFGILIIASILDSIIFKRPSVLYSLAALALFIPSIAVATRRMHDIGKSGWLLLLTLIPLVGFIVIYWLASDTRPEKNQWGEPAK